MTNIRKLPIGIQDFEDLRTNGYLYVDKTAYIYQLANFGKPYFLSRPRRFGKSLFLSTLKAYFLGKKELFEGLAIAELEKDWTEYPVFYIDFNVGLYTDAKSLCQTLDANMRYLEEKWGRVEGDNNPATRFAGLIRQAYEQSGHRVVVLIDEYDKPLLGMADDLNVSDEIRKVLKSFYGVLKSSDAYLRFVFLTGITKFSQISVFSDLNNLIDISINNRYSGVCGISQIELEQYFQPEIELIAQTKKISFDNALALLKKHYDGYRFSPNGEDMYNPFSLLNAFSDGQLRSYWFATGTPTFLAKMLKNIDFDVKTLENDVTISMDAIFNYRTDDSDPVPLLYQTGYLTIKSFDDDLNLYTLGFPNGEVKYGFYNELLPVYAQGKNILTEFYTANFVNDLQKDNIEGFMTRLKAFFADIPYKLNNKGEKHYQTIFYIFFRLMGQFVEVEYCSAVGRADAVVSTKTTVYAFEFKLTERSSAEDALRQIGEKGYLIPFTASDKRLVKVGVEFGEKERGVARWAIG